MGFYFRKSVKFGPVRLNFSKSGVGVSAGVKGLRVSTSKRGTYLNAGTNGFYYREKLGGGSHSRNVPSASSNRTLGFGALAMLGVLLLLMLGVVARFTPQRTTNHSAPLPVASHTPLVATPVTSKHRPSSTTEAAGIAVSSPVVDRSPKPSDEQPLPARVVKSASAEPSDDKRTICQDDPVPDGYMVVSMAAKEGCKGSNPLNNALIISKTRTSSYAVSADEFDAAGSAYSYSTSSRDRSRSYSGGYSGGGSVHVRSYYRRDGTYVRSHTRRR